MTFVAGGALKPIGGHILSHASATRIFLRKGMSCQSMALIPALCTAVFYYFVDFNTKSAETHRSGRAEERVAKLVDSPDKPESEASYKLDEGGWADI